MSFMNRSMLSPTLAWSGVTTRLVAARASAAVRSLVIMAGFLRGQEKDAVLQFIGRQDAVSDRDRAPRFAVPQHQGRRDLGLQAHARALPALDRVVREMTRRAAVGGNRSHRELPAIGNRLDDRAHHLAGPAGLGEEVEQRSEEHTFELHSLMRMSYSG